VLSPCGSRASTAFAGAASVEVSLGVRGGTSEAWRGAVTTTGVPAWAVKLSCMCMHVCFPLLASVELVHSILCEWQYISFGGAGARVPSQAKT